MQLITLFALTFILLFTKPTNGFCESFTQNLHQILLDNTSFAYTIHPFKKTYQLKEGWNKLTTPKDGIDIIKTFQNHPEIIYVALYDKHLAQWALFFHKDNPIKTIDNSLFLESVEANQTLFVKTKQPTTIKITTTQIYGSCKTYLNNPNFSSILASGRDEKISFSNDKTIGITPRYSTNFHRGYYNDSRVVLIYPKLQTHTKKLLSYGPAEPYISLKYSAAYESKEFFIFDYMDKQCYKGIFPSSKIPPYPLLQVLP